MDEVTTGNLDALVGYHLRRALAVVGNDFARALDGTAMRQVPFAILAMVEANPGINQGAVGRALGIQRANMVSLINELVDRDLLDRQIAPDESVQTLRNDLERIAGAKITDEDLKRSIAVYNENRKAVRELYGYRAQRPWQAPTSEVYLVLRAGCGRFPASRRTA